MTPYSANPFAYIFSVVLVGAVFLYFLYGAIDRMGLEVQTASAVITGKQFTASGKSYYTTFAGGREWVQSRTTPDTYAVVLSLGSEQTAGVVSKALYDSLQANDTVQVKIQRTRITKRLEVVDVTK
jgi:hypothetical protein